MNNQQPKPKKKKSNAGRRSRLQFINPEIVKALYQTGLEDEQVANVLKVSKRSIERYRLTNTQFCRAKKQGVKERVIQAENTMFNLAMGWKKLPPNFNALREYLYNKDPKNWRRRSEVSLGGQYNNPNSKPIETASTVVVDNRKSIKDLPTDLLEKIQEHLKDD